MSCSQITRGKFETLSDWSLRLCVFISILFYFASSSAFVTSLWFRIKLSLLDSSCREWPCPWRSCCSWVCSEGCQLYLARSLSRHFQIQRRPKIKMYGQYLDQLKPLTHWASTTLKLAALTRSITEQCYCLQCAISIQWVLTLYWWTFLRSYLTTYPIQFW